MKTPIITPLILFAALATSASGQVKSVARELNHAGAITASINTPTGRARTIGSATLNLSVAEATMDVKRYPVRPNSSRSAADPLSWAGSSSVVAAELTQVYRIGVGDVLDIQIPESFTQESTLFTVQGDGLLDYPLAVNPMPVLGLTTSEVAARLRERIKVLENPAVRVNVRDYASHGLTITGFIAAPGLKALRREAVPLFVVLAESLPLPEAVWATIVRQGQPSIEVDLTNSNASSTLVFPGDAIKVLGKPAIPTEFFFVGGAVNSPGQKPYHPGLTLTQAILASGGLTRTATARVRVSRQITGGLLNTEEYSLVNIQKGKMPDPVLQRDDRVEIASAK